MTQYKIAIDEIARRAEVLEPAASLSFNRPDALTGGTHCIGLVVPWQIPMAASNPHLTEFLEGISLVCHDAGLSMMLIPPRQGHLRRAVARGVVDGVLMLGVESAREVVGVVRQRQVPCVMVDGDPVPGIPCINTDDEAGAYAAMRCVLDHGHRHIAILGIEAVRADRDFQSGGLVQRRMSGYRRALNDVGVPFDPQHVQVIEGEPTYEAGYQAFTALWRSGRRPTAVVAMADILALGMLRAARDLGIAIPADVSLVGYDDTLLSLITDPPLTTIRQPAVEKGRLAAQWLNDLIQGYPVPAESVLLPVELIERASVRVV